MRANYIKESFLGFWIAATGIESCCLSIDLIQFYAALCIGKKANDVGWHNLCSEN
jgi:hypothetical protein